MRPARELHRGTWALSGGVHVRADCPYATYTASQLLELHAPAHALHLLRQEAVLGPHCLVGPYSSGIQVRMSVGEEGWGIWGGVEQEEGGVQTPNPFHCRGGYKPFT